jgi:Xaa-Pro aminopeptidase
MPDLPFEETEYRERQARVRAAMAERGIDILYVTSPANLLYLTGYEAVWYPPRLPVGVAVLRHDEAVVVFDWIRHEGYVRMGVLADDAVLFDYGDATRVVVDAFRSRGWLGGSVGLEGSAVNPSPGVLHELSRGLEQAGAAVVAGDWLVDGVRLYKSAAELQRIRSAGVIADRAFRRLREDLRPGRTEVEVSGHLASLIAQEGGEIAAMPPLVSAGPNAWRDTHAFPGRYVLQRDDVVSVDICGVVDRYHANLGRTFALGNGSALAREMLDLAAGGAEELVRVARLGEPPEVANAAAETYVRDRIAADRIWWLGGYSIGLGLPPSWSGHTYLANDGPQRCEWRAGYVSNYEAILFDEHEGFAATYIDTVVMTDDGLEILSELPRTLIDTSVAGGV